MTGDTPDWAIFRPVSILLILSHLFIKSHNRRYPRLGSIQPSLDTPHSELSLHNNYNRRYPRQGNIQTSLNTPHSELSVFVKSHNMRYPRLGSIQPSLDTPHSELSLYNNYNMRYPRLENIQTSVDTLPAWGISHYNFIK